MIDIDLHLMDLGRAVGGVAAFAAVLDDDERARLPRFRFAKDRRLYAGAHALLRVALSQGRAIGPSFWRFRRGPHGKPALAASGPDAPAFNLSHTRDMAAVAIGPAECDLGVDVERLDPARATLSTATVFCSAREHALLHRTAMADTGAFVALYYGFWTLKESVLKAIGCGVGEHLRAVECAARPPSAVRIPDGLHDRNRATAWSTTAFPPYALALTVLSDRVVASAPRLHVWHPVDISRGSGPTGSAPP